MTADDIKAELKSRGLTLRDFAKMLNVGYGTLRLALSGHQKLTPALRNHIELALNQHREAVLLYKIDITEAKIEEICGTKAMTSPADRAEALERVIHYNLHELIELGKTCNWSPSERAYLGLPPLPPSYDDAREPFA